MPPRTIDVFVFIGLPVAVIFWLFGLYAACGVHFEELKYKHFLFTVVIIFLFQFVILDPIKFLLQAILQTYLHYSKKWKLFRYGITIERVEPDDIQLLKMKLEWNKALLNQTWRHSDESLNIYYRNLATDLYVYGKYFILLVILISLLNEPRRFYYANSLQTKLDKANAYGWKIEHMGSVTNLMDFLHKYTIDIYNTSENDGITNWLPDEMNKVLGIVRIQQIRLKHREFGLKEYLFEDRKFRPGWTRYKSYPYENKYPKTYMPWIPIKINDGIFSNRGYLADYDWDSSYVVEMTRDLHNGDMILDFLWDKNWIDKDTVAIFIDFSAYNVDSNLFGLCRLVVECTPFGSMLVYTNFESEDFLMHWRNLNGWFWVIMIIYFLNLISFAKVLVLKIWYSPIPSIFTFWKLLDFLIIILNVLAFTFLYYREKTVIQSVNNFDAHWKEQFISFRGPRILTRSVEITLALLVFCATVRLWKVFLFARVFRLYLRTLQLGAVDIILALLNIVIILIGLIVSSYLINGPIRTRSNAPLSFIHVLSFSLGYSERLDPNERSEIKHKQLGLIVYAIVISFVTTVLLNMLITLICIHYAQAKEEERLNPPVKISFWEFLMVEYADVFQFFHKLRQRIHHKLRKPKKEHFSRNVRTVKSKLGFKPAKKREYKPSEIAEKHEAQLRHTRIITDIISIQFEILQRRLENLNIKLLPENTNGQT